MVSHLAKVPISFFQEMWETERHHLRTMDSLQHQHRVRPTVLYPVWKGAAMGLGVVTALMGKKALMACTEAVETVIGEHYDESVDARFRHNCVHARVADSRLMSFPPSQSNQSTQRDAPTLTTIRINAVNCTHLTDFHQRSCPTPIPPSAPLSPHRIP
jgi:demethoxyubiquinone hydroxylase (CLK1/Coq7/Cat5 family)